MIEEAGKKGVQILCLQEIFNGPYFCPSQNARWYDAAEPVPGPTVQRLMPHRQEVQHGDGRAGLRAGDGRRVLQHRGGARPRRQLPRQIPQEPHSAREPGLLREVLLQAGQPRVSDLQAVVGRRPSASTSATTATSRRARACSACTAPRSCSTRRRRWPGSRSTCGSWSSRRTRWPTATSSAPPTASAPRRRGTSASSMARRYFCDPRGNFVTRRLGGQGRAGDRRSRPVADRRSAQDLAVLPRPPVPTATAHWPLKDHVLQTVAASRAASARSRAVAGEPRRALPVEGGGTPPGRQTRSPARVKGESEWRLLFHRRDRAARRRLAARWGARRVEKWLLAHDVKFKKGNGIFARIRNSRLYWRETRRRGAGLVGARLHRRAACPRGDPVLYLKGTNKI